jgi:hypothetical protein
MRRLNVWSALVFTSALFGGVSSHAQLAYVANFYAGSVSGSTVDSNTGVLTTVARSLFTSGSEPVFVAFAHASRP